MSEELEKRGNYLHAHDVGDLAACRRSGSLADSPDLSRAHDGASNLSNRNGIDDL